MFLSDSVTTPAIAGLFAVLDGVLSVALNTSQVTAWGETFMKCLDVARYFDSL